MGILICFLLVVFCTVRAAKISPTQPSRWDTVTLSFRGPQTHEKESPNPFTDFRLDVLFTHKASSVSISVPGFFAADGNAAQTSADGGRVWQVRFTPSRTGTWSYEASFKAGPYVVTNIDAGGGDAFDGEKSEFSVVESQYKGPDLRAYGRLQYVAQRYFRYSNGKYKLKLGTNTPENFLAYFGFDGEQGPLTYASHEKDWRQGDPTWGSAIRGKEIIGAINYLASQGVNSLFAMLMTVKGDSGGQVHPWISTSDRVRYDVSKLEQWQLVFDHASRKGLSLNLAFLETENEALFEHDEQLSTSTGFARSRKVFYREMIARFGHHLGFTMTLGEENGWSEQIHEGGGHPWGVGNSALQRQLFTRFIRDIDPFDCPISVHTLPREKNEVYGPMLGPTSGVRIEGASLQMRRKWTTFPETLEWISRSVASGLPWVVTADEIGSDGVGMHGGVPLESGNGTLHVGFRATFCWGNILAGGGGIEVYSAPADQSLNDFRELHSAWGDFSRPLQLFDQHNIPFWAMGNVDDVVKPRESVREGQWYYAFAKLGDLYILYQSGGIDLLLDLRGYGGEFQVRWFNPRRWTSTELQMGSVAIARSSPKLTALGSPPTAPELDWVVVVARKFPLLERTAMAFPLSPRDLIPGSLTLGRAAPNWNP